MQNFTQTLWEGSLMRSQHYTPSPCSSVTLVQWMKMEYGLNHTRQIVHTNGELRKATSHRISWEDEASRRKMAHLKYRLWVKSGLPVASMEEQMEAWW